MAKQTNELAEILTTLLITQLGLAGIPQPSIRKIAKCDMNRVNSIVKHLKPAKKSETKKQ